MKTKLEWKRQKWRKRAREKREETQKWDIFSFCTLYRKNRLRQRRLDHDCDLENKTVTIRTAGATAKVASHARGPRTPSRATHPPLGQQTWSWIWSRPGRGPIMGVTTLAHHERNQPETEHLDCCSEASLNTPKVQTTQVQPKPLEQIYVLSGKIKWVEFLTRASTISST